MKCQIVQRVHLTLTAASDWTFLNGTFERVEKLWQARVQEIYTVNFKMYIYITYTISVK